MIPKKILIGTQVWEVVERNPQEDAQLADDTYGYTLERQNVIVLDKNLPFTRKRQVLMHELMHAIRFTYVRRPSFKKTDDFESIEHFFIELYEEALLLVFRDNPELMQYFLS